MLLDVSEPFGIELMIIGDGFYFSQLGDPT
jgi:hypothetical protein